MFWPAIGIAQDFQTGLIAAVDRFIIGARGVPTEDEFYNDDIAAVAWWHGDDCATPGDCWNSGDPWSVIGISTATTDYALMRRRGR